MSLTTDSYQLAPWAQVLIDKVDEDEKSKKEAYQKYINNLMQNENYDPTAKIGFWDKFAPWDTKNKKAVQINNLISAMEQEASGVDMRAFQQDNRTWGGKLYDKIAGNEGNYEYTGIDKYDNKIDSEKYLKEQEDFRRKVREQSNKNKYEWEDDGFIDSLFPSDKQNGAW